jgi:hypothetical protein
VPIGTKVSLPLGETRGETRLIRATSLKTEVPHLEQETSSAVEISTSNGWLGVFMIFPFKKKQTLS